MTQATTPVVVIAQQNTTLAEALAIAAARGGFSVAAQVNDLDSLVSAVDSHEPDLVVTSSTLDDQQISPSLAALSRTGAVVVISPPSTDEAISTQLLAGAQGWFDVDIPLAEILAGLRRVAEGWPVLSGPAAQLVLHEWRDRRRADVRATPGLTERESEILIRMSHGSTTKEIAGDLNLAPKTVENHKSRVFSKLGAHNSSHALAIAADLGLLEG